MYRVIHFRLFFVGRNALEKKLIFLNKYFPGIFRRFHGLDFDALSCRPTSILKLDLKSIG